MSIETWVKETLIDQLEVKETEIRPESNLVNDLGVESIDFVALIMATEEKFGLEINNEDAGKLLTVQDIIDYIKKRTKEKS